MNLFIKILTLGLFAILFVSCNSTPKKASKYNQSVINENKAVLLKEGILIDLINKNNSSKLDNAYDEFLLQINNSIYTINNLTPFHQDTLLKKASLQFLNTYKNTAENEYKQVVRIAKLPSDKFKVTDDKLLKEVSEEINKKLQKALDEFIRADKIFEKQNALRITQ